MDWPLNSQGFGDWVSNEGFPCSWCSDVEIPSPGIWRMGVAWKGSGLLRRVMAWQARDTRVVGPEGGDRHQQQGLYLPTIVERTKGRGPCWKQESVSSLLSRRYKFL